MKVVVGGSPGDSKALHFTHSGKFGLGHERHVALFYPSTNTLVIHPGNAHRLKRILDALKKYRTAEQEPQILVNVLYW